jgi:hypothetical protein
MPTHWIRHFGRNEDRMTSSYWQDTPESGPREGDLFEAIRHIADKAIGGPTNSANSRLRIEVLGFASCPHTRATRINVEKAVGSMGLIAEIEYVDQDQLLDSDGRRGWPAPTVLVNGHDLFGLRAPMSAAMGCRVYAGGVPSESDVARALKSITQCDSAPLVCTLPPEQLNARRDELLPGLIDRADERIALERGYRLRFTARPGLLDEIAQVIEQERGCCQFLEFQIIVEPENGPIFVEVAGPPGTREIIDAF